MKKQFASFCFAFIFFTRIPIKLRSPYTPKIAEGATKYLPAVGWVVGGFSALVLWASLFIFPFSISIILSLISVILITGAFHEDGLADVCDGFGGGSTAEKKLEIMKDSHIGTYGVISLILVLVFRFVLLFEIDTSLLPFVIIAAHSLSRSAAVSIMQTHKYVRKENQSKVLHVIKKISFSDIIVSAIFGIAPLLLFQNIYFFLLIIPVFITRWLLGLLFKQQIGGYTGDCLGATQQICEIVFYMSYFLLWKYI
jgi:adenosylcobinamide-GDP ribazoletransferase